MSKKSDWAVVLDCDGTLTPKPHCSLFHLIVTHGGLSQAARERLAEIKAQFIPRALEGTLSMTEEVEWLRQEVETWVSDGLGPQQAAQAIAQVAFRPQVAECLAWLKSRRVPVAVISYGIRPFILMALHSLGLADLVDQVYAMDLKVDYRTGRYVGMVPRTMVVPANKGLQSRRFARQHGIRPDRLLAVGDTHGDRLLGHLRGNRFGLAADESDRERLQPFFDRVAVTEGFEPAWRWLKRKMR